VKHCEKPQGLKKYNEVLGCFMAQRRSSTVLESAYSLLCCVSAKRGTRPFATLNGIPEQSRVPRDKFISNRAIAQALTGCDTVLIKGSWLKKRLRSHDPLLPRRQDIEANNPHAIWKVSDLMDGAANGEIGIVSVSYCWLSQEHPDPFNKQFFVLADTIDAFLEGTQLTDVAVFLDWCSLHQDPRSVDEEESFQRAMSDVILWYAHQGTRVWMMSSVPDDVGRGEPYHERGWPIFEETLAKWITHGNFLLDLGKLKGKCVDWREIVDKCAKPKRPPPMTADDFWPQLKNKVFGQGIRDANLVHRLYCKAYEEVILNASELSFHELGWGDEDAIKFAEHLPKCSCLHKVALHGNAIGERGAMKIMHMVNFCDSLQELWLTGNPVCRDKLVKEQLATKWVLMNKDDKGLHI